ncbi:molybdate ABC transporter permease subunit [Paenibacillus sp. PL91]|uniref:molybdate ABC transporter permease subunit n=1 Tax=Paenibacillus sp. PL91 TaxID=2729538 RepID=UPI00145E336D|nr:molybdate ABC transporter permease subunit [Paenibacillus sp. PL91]MBC9199423.1 molybdate ABC transporter permease subunit [Paenibacillus sp. PL91]
MNWDVWLPPVALSLKVSLFASIIVAIIGMLAARFMTQHSFKGKSIIETIFMLPLVLPPTVVGFILLLLLGRGSWIGQAYEWLFAQPIVFSWIAAIIAAVIVAFPLVYQTMKVGFLSVDRHLEDAARSAGGSELQVLRFITLPLAKRSLVTAYLLGFARSIGEFGATLMIAGNIPGRTQTVPTAIYIAVETGETGMAWAWTIAIIAFSFVMLLFTGRRLDQ